MASDSESLAFEEESFHDPNGRGTSSGLPPLHSSPSPKNEHLTTDALRKNTQSSPPRLPPKLSASDQLKKVFRNKIGRNRSNSIASNNSSIAFQTEGDGSVTTPPLVPPQPKTKSPSLAQGYDSEQSIAFRMENSISSASRRASPPRSVSPPLAGGNHVSNESIAFQFEGDKTSSDNEKSKGNLYVPLRDRNLHDGEESIAFQSVNNSFTSPPAGFHDNASIAFQIQDSSLSAPPATIDLPKVHNITTTPKKSDAAESGGAKSPVNTSIAFQVEDTNSNPLYGKTPALLSAGTSSVYDPIPLALTKRHTDDDEDDFNMSPGLLSSTRVNSKKSGSTKKTIVSNHLKQRSNPTSPVPKRLKLSSPGLEKNTDSPDNSATFPSPHDAPTKGFTPPGVNMPKKKASVQSERSATILHHSSDKSSGSDSVDEPPPIERDATSPEFVNQPLNREHSEGPPDDTANTRTPRGLHEGSRSNPHSRTSSMGKPTPTKYRRSTSSNGVPPRSRPPLSPVEFHPPCKVTSQGKGTPLTEDGDSFPSVEVQHQRTTTGIYHEGGGVSNAKEPKEEYETVKEEADYWEVFNQEQRDELLRLTKAISAAQRQDRTVLEQSLTKDRATPVAKRAPEPRSPASTFAKKGTKVNVMEFSSPIPNPRVPQPAPRPVVGGYSTMAKGNQKKVSLIQKSVTEDDKQKNKTPLRKKRNNNSPNRTPSPPFRKTNDASVESLADMLGILWPPTGRQLYFVNGTRLTEDQVRSFYETVQVQQEASVLQNKAWDCLVEAAQPKNRVILSPSKLREVSPQTGRSPLDELYEDCPIKPKHNRRLQLHRTKVLREAFDLLDIKQSHCLRSDTLASLKYLLEVDLGKMEQKLFERPAAAPHGEIRQKTLLASAVESRNLFEKAWTETCRRNPVLTRSRSRSPLDGVEELEDDRYDALSEMDQLVLEKAKLSRKALLYSFAVNVVLPLLLVSCIDEFDFSTFCLVIFNALNEKGKQTTKEGKAWRQVVAQYFSVLSR